MGEDVEKKGTLVHCWWERKLVQYGGSTKDKNRATMQSRHSNSMYRCLDKENKNTNLKRYMHVHCMIIYNSQDMEAKFSLINEWIKKIYIYNSAIKKNEILAFVTTWMNLEGITLSEISQTEINDFT